MSKKLANKVAVVTGASKGIGAAIAKQLAAEGAAVVVNYASSRAGADSVVEDITGAGGTAIAVQANVSQPQDIQRLFSEARERFGQLDILVNNAGIYRFASLEEITPEDFHQQFNLNVLGLILCTQEAVKYFGPEGGSVINISSIITATCPPNGTIYAATKGAVDIVTRTLANELGPRKIRVNAVSPGLVITEGSKSAGIADAENEMNQELVQNTPLGRAGVPDDIAPAVAFLAGPDAHWVTGETMFVGGGLR